MLDRGDDEQLKEMVPVFCYFGENRCTGAVGIARTVLDQRARTSSYHHPNSTDLLWRCDAFYAHRTGQTDQYLSRRLNEHLCRDGRDCSPIPHNRQTRKDRELRCSTQTTILLKGALVKKQLAIALGLCLMILLVGAADMVQAYPHLPSQVAQHFNLQGQPDSWCSRAQYVALMTTLWIVLPGFMLVVAMSIYYVPARFVSLPHKEYWLAPKRKESTRHALGNRMVWLSTTMALFLVALNHDVIVANLSKPPQAPDNLWWIAGALVTVTFAWTSEIYWRFRRPSNKTTDL
jgi:hypothetical protein